MIADDGRFPTAREFPESDWRVRRDHVWDLPRIGRRWSSSGISNELISAGFNVLTRDDFIDLGKMSKALLIIQRFGISPALLNQVNKSIWISLIDQYDNIAWYTVEGQSFQHWRLTAKTASGVLIMAELFGEPGRQLQHLEYTIRARNADSFDHDTPYIYPRVLVNVEERGLTMDMCSVSWNDFIISVALDEQAFRPYNKALNNCQQWCERVCRRLQLAAPMPILPDRAVASLRTSDQSAQGESHTHNTASDQQDTGGIYGLNSVESNRQWCVLL